MAHGITPIQVDVHAPPGGAVTSVTAKIGSEVTALSHGSFGQSGWAHSPKSAIPHGATVQFTAKDDEGHVGTWSTVMP